MGLWLVSLKSSQLIDYVLTSCASHEFPEDYSAYLIKPSPQPKAVIGGEPGGRAAVHVDDDAAKHKAESPDIGNKVEPGHDVFAKHAEEPKAQPSGADGGPPLEGAAKKDQPKKADAPPVVPAAEKKVVAAKDVVGQKEGQKKTDDAPVPAPAPAAAEHDEEPADSDHKGVDPPLQGPHVPPAPAPAAAPPPAEEKKVEKVEEKKADAV